VVVKARLLDDRADAREGRRSLLWDREPEYVHRSAARWGEAEQHSYERGLSGAVGAEVAKRGAGRNVQIHGLDDGAVAKALREVGCGDCVNFGVHPTILLRNTY
jgi:hypothetical protein